MTCTLCGLESGDAEFCCAGCENVYAILRESGIVAPGQSFRDTDLFQQSLRLGLISKGAGAAPPPPTGETREAVFQLSGMWCTSCGWLIEHALARTRGVVSAEVLFASDLLKVRYCPQYLPPERIVERVASLGYRAAEPGGRTLRRGAQGPAAAAGRIGVSVDERHDVQPGGLCQLLRARHRQLRTLHSIPADGAGHPRGLLLRGSGAADRLDGRAPPRAAHGDAAGAGDPLGLRIQRGLVDPGRPPRVLRHGLRDRDAGAGGQGHRTRRQGQDHAGDHAALPADAEQGAGHHGKRRAVRIARRAEAGDRVPGEVGRADSGRRRSAGRTVARRRIGADGRIRAAPKDRAMA